MERFSALFDELLHNLSQKNLDSYVFMDSNIDLLNLDIPSSANFLNSILSKGFLQCTVKATRIHNNSKTLIDNILTNRAGAITTGTVISDISDHFFTFIQEPKKTFINREKTFTFRQFTEQNLTNFKMALGGVDWNIVTSSNDADTACNEFWRIYNELYNLIFPEKTIRFNKNVHKKQPFMTAGLLKSRTTKKYSIS